LSVGIISLFILSAVAPIGLGLNIKISKIHQPSNIVYGNTLYVGGSGPNNYTKIQEAIDNASNGDTVYVYDDSSPYYENIEIWEKSINLEGENKDTTIIDGGGKPDDSVDIRSDYVEICCFTIKNGFRGINIYNSDNHKVHFNNIINNWNGLSLMYSNNNQIFNNSISNNDYKGIVVHFRSSNNTFSHNDILYNNQDGIWFEACCNNTISNNIIKLNERSGLWFEDPCYNNTIYKNTIFLNKDYGLHCCNDFSRNTITVNTFINNRVGIYIVNGVHFSSDNNQIYHNNFINNTVNAVDVCNNIWDDGKYGNYWDNYEELYPDAKKSLLKPWMWNTPYEFIGGDNKDNCPLINQWKNPRPRSITRNTPTYNPVWFRFFDMFPILQRILQILR
jgi:parallel beta-helix repeat protein